MKRHTKLVAMSQKKTKMIRLRLELRTFCVQVSFARQLLDRDHNQLDHRTVSSSFWIRRQVRIDNIIRSEQLSSPASAPPLWPLFARHAPDPTSDTRPLGSPLAADSPRPASHVVSHVTDGVGLRGFVHLRHQCATRAAPGLHPPPLLLPRPPPASFLRPLFPDD